VQELGVEEAERLLAAGWRQGSVFRPNEHVPPPDGCPEDGVLVVVSQSCTVVSPRWDRDPYVEIALAVPSKKPFEKQKRSPQAVGKDFRTLLLPAPCGDADCLVVDVYSRFFISRQLLLSFAPDVASGDSASARRLAAWMGRHFTRAALPNKLVKLLADSVTDPLEKHLRSGFGEGPLHDGVVAIWVKWEPDDETGPYDMEFLIACDSEEAANHLDGLLTETFGTEAPIKLESNEVRVQVRVQSAEGTTLADVEGHHRLSSFDHFTNLEAPVSD
jgi:hypothetical protein